MVRISGESTMHSAATTRAAGNNYPKETAELSSRGNFDSDRDKWGGAEVAVASSWQPDPVLQHMTRH